MAYGSYSDVIQQEFWSASQWNTKYFSAFLRWQYCQDVANNKTKFKFLDITFVNHVDGRGIYASTIHAQGSIANQNTSEKTAQNKITTTGNTVVTINEEKEVTHNADGTFPAWQVAARVWATGQSDSIVPQSAPAFSCLTTNIPKIPRVSGAGVTSSSLAMGSVQVIKINRQTTAYTHKLYYKFHNQSDWTEINTGNANGINTDTFAWTTPNLASLIPNATGGSCQVMVRTMSGSTIIGDSITSFTLTVPTTYVPSISTITIAEGGSAVPSSYGMFVQSKSLLKVTISASGHSKSTIKTYKIEFDGKSYSGSSNVLTTNIINGSGTLSLKATVTDSRGRTATKTQNVSITAYSAPSISTFSAVRCTSNGTASDDGTYVKFSFKFAITALGDKNSRSFKLQVYANNAWSDLKSITDSYGTESTFITTTTYSVDNTYRFRAYCADYFSNATVERNVDPSFSLIDLGNDGKSIAFGGVADDNGTFHSKIPSKLKLHRSGGSYIYGKPVTNHALYYDGTGSHIGWETILGVSTVNNHSFSVGKIYDQFGVIGFKSDRTENGYDCGVWLDMARNVFAYNGSEVLSIANFMEKTKHSYYYVAGASNAASWVHLGDVTGSWDGENTIIHMYTGNGWNGRTDQNTTIHIHIKDASQSTVSATTSQGVTYWVEGIYHNSIQIKVIATTSANYQVWAYLPWNYWNFCYEVFTRATWTNSGAKQSGAPSGTAQNVANLTPDMKGWPIGSVMFLEGDKGNPANLVGGTWTMGFIAWGLHPNNRMITTTSDADDANINLHGFGNNYSQRQKFKPFWTDTNMTSLTTRNCYAWFRTA